MDKVHFLVSLLICLGAVNSVCRASTEECDSMISAKNESIKELVSLMGTTFEGITELVRIAQDKLTLMGFEDTPGKDLRVSTHLPQPVTDSPAIATPVEWVESKDTDNLKSDCSGLFKSGHNKSGIYRIWPKFLRYSVKVYCDMDTDGGGWTVIQRRGDFMPHVNFFEGWDMYKNGFGNLSTEFWLGNDNIFALTNQQKTTLRVDLEDFEGVKAYATYNTFLIGSEVEKYVLTIEGYHGDAGNSMETHNGKVFATKDNDATVCSGTYRGAWWFGNCHKAHLNGLYHGGKHESYADGLNWYDFKGYYYSLKTSEMKIRPTVY